MDKFLKWVPTIVGLILFITGIVLKIIEGAKSYDAFISGNSYIILVVGVEAILLNFAFNHILSDNDSPKGQKDNN